MVAKAAELDGTAMSWEEFDALGEIRAEYIDGRVVMAPSPMRRHQQASYRLATLLESAVRPGFRRDAGLVLEAGPGRVRADILVHPSTDEQVRFTGTRCW